MIVQTKMTFQHYLILKLTLFDVKELVKLI